MDPISDVELFVAVVEAGGFSGAARRLGRTQPALSRRIAALESRLGVRLLERSTRRLRLTEAGALFHARCREALAVLQQAEEAVAEAAGGARGGLRVSAPPAYARSRLPAKLAAFSAAYPDVAVELVAVERYVDLIAEGFDVALRLGPVRDSSLASRIVSRERYVLCAAPSYLERHGAPASLAEISQRNCLLLATDRRLDRWPFRGGGRTQIVEVRGSLRSNDAGLLHAAAIAGAGITALPTYLVEADLKRGDLVELLPSHRLPSFTVIALFAGRRQLPRKVRAFIDCLTG